ncbi:DUF2971 domain-containing protein [Mycolicibacter arupensis]|uniref:DUF2971 domain-containing protein n=1 Tax=Mycolicibacter arupensis TaxID=342002 RepID=A0ABX3RDA8_9MYCO|nr:DUF2971 domain-containing protein [Mycolicibacter arupensis]MCV7277037.1 DUF2971 domain-containing protein [Mycolicibacter arupensis]OQZ91974.1 hypothetical protein BST15_19490 [Mycolicibacter arupensis]
MPAIYHYTDAQAFAKIIENAELWATDFRYLNDSREFRYAWKPFVKALRNLSPAGGDYSETYKAQITILQETNSIKLANLDSSVFVACFTERRDAISQWSRYGANGHGVALGFNAEAIAKVRAPLYSLTPMLCNVQPEQMASLHKVNYGKVARRVHVDRLIQMVKSCGKQDGVDTQYRIGNLISMFPALIESLSLTKDSGFKDEREHRLVLHEFQGYTDKWREILSRQPQPYSDLAKTSPLTVDVQFRAAGPSLFKPYILLPFDRSALMEVVIGPSNKNNLTKPTVEKFLRRYGFSNTEVSLSKRPYQT